MARRRRKKKKAKRLFYWAAWVWGSCLQVLDRLSEAIWHFLCNWFVSRPYKEFLWGLPAVLVALAVTIGWVTSGRSSSVLAERYRRSVADALEQGDTRAAQLWLTKAVKLDPDEPTYLYRLALTAEEDGRLNRARDIMRRIAPVRQHGHPAAHLWMARDLVRNRPPLTPQLGQSLEHHLTRASMDPDLAAEAHGLLGRLYLKLNQPDQAMSHLERAADTQPEAAVHLGHQYAVQGKQERASGLLRKAADQFQTVLNSEPDNIEARLYLANSQSLLGDFEQAAETLQEGLSFGSPQIAGRLADLYLTQAEQVWQQADGKAEEVLTLLEKADEQVPNSPAVLNSMSQLAAGAGPARNRVRELLRDKVRRGEETSFVHFVLGVIAERDDNFILAIAHYNRALELGPKTMELLNNLAWALANQEQPDLDEALKAVEAALEMAPDHPWVLDTRGQILAKLGRWSECVSDLERALPRMDNRAPLHDTLALAYSQLGDPELAAAHRRKADECRQGASPQPR